MENKKGFYYYTFINIISKSKLLNSSSRDSVKSNYNHESNKLLN